VGLVTADTYRIAAVEQLKTYADILGLEIRTVYKPEEMSAQMNSLVPPHDVVLVDTAGRSHKNKGNLADLKMILDEIPDSVRYLVLSINTRYKDLISIINAYSQIADFDLIFTKLDESDNLGNLVNICCLTEKKPAYVTFGQSVPEDFDAVKPDSIAKSLLGLNGENPYGHPDSPDRLGGDAL
jgi:flagellar biosynthesis protein FlhF